jgi:SPP1 family predicted phage head-tail adaptor
MNEFPHTVTFQQFTKVPDGGGGYTESWDDFLTTEAHVQPISSNQFAQAQQLTNPIDHNVFYPHQEGVKGSMRAIWHDRNDSILELRSGPLDQGGMSEILMVKGQLK